MSRVATTKWNLFFFYLRTIIGFANGVLIVPLYLKYIDNTLFGLWLASGNILTWITIIDPGVGDVLIQKVSAAYSKKNKKLLEYLLSSAVIVSSIVTIVAFLLSFSLSFFIKDILKLSDNAPIDELIFAYNINAIATCVTLFSFCLSGAILGFQRTKEVGIILTITGLLGIVLNVFLLLNNFGLSSIAYSSLFKSLSSSLIYSIFLIGLLKNQRIGFKLNLRYFRSFIKLFTYTFFSKFFGTIASNIDLVIISRYLGPNAVTILELTRRPLRVIQSFVNIPSQSLLPAFSNLYAEGNKEKIRELIKRFVTVFSFTLFLMISGFIIFNKELITIWVGPSFYIGDLNNILLCISVLTATFSYNLSNFTYSMGNIKGNSKIETFKSIFYIILLMLLVKTIGITGALLGVLISSLSTETWYYPFIILKKVKLEFQDLKAIKSTLIVGLLISFVLIILFYFYNVDSWYFIGIKGVLFMALYALLFYSFDISFKSEFQKGKNLIFNKIFK